MARALGLGLLLAILLYVKIPLVPIAALAAIAGAMIRK